MRRVFILDDIRDEMAAYHNASLSISNMVSDEIMLVRTFDEGIKAITERERFDLWILDHDLGCYAPNSSEQNGYDFLMHGIYITPEKIPTLLVSCSSNPVGKERILALFNNWKIHNT